MELLSNQLEEEEMWYRWTYAVNSSKQKTRSFISIEAYIQALQMTIIAHDRLYENNSSIITDSMYDDL